ncbi:hypothetical protein [Streptomyces sp. NPDC088923]|uniref:hypothetical protein n=1 Tax=Streptomyces sp. NPDC088923 TaxID=3365913 RepID=UPI003810FCAA
MSENEPPVNPTAEATEPVGPAEATTPAEAVTARAEAVTASAEVVEPAGAAPVRKRRPRLRTVLGYALPAVMLVGAGAGSFAYVKHSVDGADRTVATRQWDTDAPAAKRPKSTYGKGSAQGKLQRQLLPVPDGYALGPYVTEGSDDVELSSREIAQWLTSSAAGQGLGAEEREGVDRVVRTSAPRALAVRSYAAPDDSVYIVSLSQSKGGKPAASVLKPSVAAMEKNLKKGPAVPGHAKDAACFRMPGMEDTDGTAVDLARLTCVAWHGDLSVAIDATGADPLNSHAAVAFFARQLDRLKSTGTAV